MKNSNSSKLAALVLAGSVTGHAANWEKLEPLPAPNGGLICGEVGGKIVIIGGTNWETGEKKNWLREVYQLDPATLRWALLASLKQPLAYAVGGNIGAAFVVVGGSTGAAPFAGVVRVENGRVHDQPVGGVPVAAVLSAGGVVGDEIMFSGGTDDAANIKGMGNRTYAWNSRTGALRTLAPAPTVGFGTATSLVVAGQLYVFGGVSWDPKTQAIANLAGVHVYSPASNTWRSLQAMPHPLRGHQAVALDDNLLYIAGGYGPDGFTDAAFVYDIAGDRYLSAPPLPIPLGTHVLRVGEYVYCFGGEDRIKHRTSAVYRIKVSELLPRK